MLYSSLTASSNFIVTPNKKTGAEAPVKATEECGCELVIKKEFLRQDQPLLLAY
jgi:hypothetical protein